MATPRLRSHLSEFKEFTVDAALLRELGERLVGKPHVALSELVKNSYDADATEVVITFGEDSITVTDNGTGMSSSDFIDYWLRVGTIHKQQNTTTSRGRTVTGSKGIGRLSVQFLGEQLELVSRKQKSNAFYAAVDWPKNIDAGDLIKAGAHVGDADPDILIGGKFRHGTSVTITGLKQVWGRQELRDLARELWFLQPPSMLVRSLSAKDKFNISLQGVPEEIEETFSEQMEQAFENWIAVIEGELKGGRSGNKASVTVTFKNGDAYPASYKVDGNFLDAAKFKIYVFKLSGKQSGGVEVTAARKYFRRYGGVHVYDNNFRLPFYGGEEQDWLGLEYDHSHRLNKSTLLPAEFQVSSGLNDLPTNGRIFGLVQISTSHERSVAAQREVRRGSYLNVQVTRDRLIDNGAFKQLVDTVRWAIDFYAMRSYERRQQEKLTKLLEVPETEEKTSEIKEQLFQIALSAPPPVARQIEIVSERFQELQDLEEQRKNALNAERVLLAALATTGMAALAMEHELQKELVILNGIRDQLKLKRASINEAKIVEALDKWAERTTRARKLFSPLMNEYDREKRNKYRACKVIDQIVKNSEAVMRDVSVEVQVPADLKLPEATFAAWNAIFQNVLINAVNAMIGSKVRKIECTSVSERQHHAIYIQDTGAGVRLHDSSDLFKPFVRRLEIPEERKSLGLGGMGIGLTIVKMVADSLECHVSFVEPAPPFKTAFKIEWSDE
ncbi:ATP-binding protein [Pseudomonas sp. 21]|uniref:ATP-binding protein n=1 Tax=Pseudomonas sp. 21 TaxID=1619948 RepID=UPI0009E20747|nr:ATP-binding protein [Pseudomonas sp. 21]